MNIYNRGYFIILIIVFILISYFELNLIPDYLNLENHVEPKSIIEIIITSVTTILGLLIAVIFIYFEIIQTKFSQWANKLVFERKEIQNFFMVFIMMFTFAFITFLNLKNEVSSQSLNQLYFCIYFFIFSLFTIPNLLKGLVSGTKHEKIIQDGIDSLKKEDFDQILKSERFDNLEIENQALTENTKFILTFLNNYVKDNNKYKLELIISQLARKITDVSGFGIYRDDTNQRLQLLIYFYRRIVDESFKYGNYETIKYMIDTLSNMHRLVVLNKFDPLNFKELDYFFDYLIIKCFQFDSNDLIKRISNLLAVNITNQLSQNCPKENELKMFFSIEKLGIEYNEKGNTNLTSLWDYIEHDYLHQFTRIYDHILAYKKIELIREFNFITHTLINDILNLDIGKNLKGILAWELQSNMNFQTIDAIEDARIKINPRDIYQIKLSDLRHIIENEEFYVYRLIETSFVFFLDLIPHKPRKLFLLQYEIAVFGRIASIKISEKEIYQRILKYVRKKLKEAKKLYEKDLDFYSEEYRQLRSLFIEYKNNIEKNSDTNHPEFKKFEKLISHFEPKNLLDKKAIRLEKNDNN